MKYLVCLQRDGYSHTLRILRVPTTTPSSLQYFVTASVSTPSTSAASSSSSTLNRSGSAFILSPRTVLLTSSVSSSAEREEYLFHTPYSKSSQRNRPIQTLLVDDVRYFHALESKLEFKCYIPQSNYVVPIQLSIVKLQSQSRDIGNYIDNRTTVDVVTDVLGTSVLLCQSFSDARLATSPLHTTAPSTTAVATLALLRPHRMPQLITTLGIGHKEETLASSRLHTRLLESSSAAPPFLRLPLFGPSFSILVILEVVVKAIFSIEFPRTCEIFSHIVPTQFCTILNGFVCHLSPPVLPANYSTRLDLLQTQQLHNSYTTATPQGSERTRLRIPRTTTVSACEDPGTKVKLSAGNQDKVVKKPAVKKANGKGMRNKAENGRY
ncbi:hypothetical protein K457DRAFT_25517 [Linnemannia elongata AG-77]|uniref:Uncharacterized protein n=1 Tax=Linnemannia elongata AG-77 TaxID=1314771 RepID=A0A197JCX0_9FUNG|nr:hypothetical protein K457DRAFT_25517 [Linnemannia elongata AG-77]